MVTFFSHFHASVITASGQLPKNFFLGTLADLGSFDQCLNNDLKPSSHGLMKFKGQYCLAALEPISPISLNEEDDTRFTHHWSSQSPHKFERKYNISIYIGICSPSLCTSSEVENLIKDGNFSDILLTTCSQDWFHFTVRDSYDTLFMGNSEGSILSDETGLFSITARSFIQPKVKLVSPKKYPSFYIQSP